MAGEHEKAKVAGAGESEADFHHDFAATLEKHHVPDSLKTFLVSRYGV